MDQQAARRPCSFNTSRPVARWRRSPGQLGRQEASPPSGGRHRQVAADHRNGTSPEARVSSGSRSLRCWTVRGVRRLHAPRRGNGRDRDVLGMGSELVGARLLLSCHHCSGNCCTDRSTSARVLPLAPRRDLALRTSHAEVNAPMTRQRPNLTVERTPGATGLEASMFIQRLAACRSMAPLTFNVRPSPLWQACPCPRLS